MNYRLLNVGEDIEPGDEFLRMQSWPPEWVPLSQGNLEQWHLTSGDLCTVTVDTVPVRREMKT